ncbi:hypothetical protein EsDP_00005233 [Epichloe bromicola]|uniref:F-box domain-containing protein n=1 Tax=Epichloe bromicola TaxID=79588 RepID=A0ABQ0CU27_9HYPO
MAAIDTLPNEVLFVSLAFLSARELVQLLPVSRRFHALTTRMLHRRLVDVSSLSHNELILECYPPIARLSAPTLTCRFLGLKHAGEDGINGDSPSSGDLSRLYSAFRPVLVEEVPRRRRRVSWSGGQASRVGEPATLEVNVDQGEVFSQLCVSTSVVKETVQQGIYVSHVNVCDGVIRVWRQWLAERAGSSGMDGQDEHDAVAAIDSNNILWVDAAKNVGLKFRVEMGPMERMPLLSGPGDDGPVSYILIYQELIVRTTSLLLAMDASAVQEVSRSSKAVVISEFW